MNKQGRKDVFRCWKHSTLVKESQREVIVFKLGLQHVRGDGGKVKFTFLHTPRQGAFSHLVHFCKQIHNIV